MRTEDWVGLAAACGATASAKGDVRLCATPYFFRLRSARWLTLHELEKDGNNRASPCRKTTTQGLLKTIQAEKRQVMLKGYGVNRFFAQSSALSTQN